MLLSVDEIKDAVKRYNSFSDKTQDIDVSELSQEMAIDTEDASIAENVRYGNLIGDEKNRVKRREMIQSFSIEPTDFAYERAIGNNDSVYSNFIELIANAKRKIGRIVIKDGSDNLGYATGFLISDNLLMTN